MQAALAPACPTPAAAPQLGWSQITVHRSFLVRFAERKLLDPCLAEDLVHDVFEAVVSGRARFEGRSALRSWLVAVLKNKIVDLVRERAPQQSLDALLEAEDGLAFEPASPEPGPEQQAQARELLAQTLGRIAALPDSLRRTVELRLLHERSTEEVCRTLQISEDNLFVRLHRARKALAH